MTSIEDVLSGSARYALHCGDGFALAKTLPERCCVVICDPPYDARTHNRARTCRNGVASDIEIDFDPLTSFEFVPDLLRVTRSWALAFCALEHFGEYQRASGDGWVRAGLWHRPNSMGSLNADRPAQVCEGIAIMHRVDVKKAWNGSGYAMWSHLAIKNSCSEQDRYHETQKPISLMIDLVKSFTDPDDIVYDCTAGSCTTGVAALMTGRRFIGAEIDKDKHATGLARLVAAADGQTLKSARAGQLTLFGATNHKH